MKASELIELLRMVIEEHGDLPVHPSSTDICGSWWKC